MFVASRHAVPWHIHQTMKETMLYKCQVSRLSGAYFSTHKAGTGTANNTKTGGWGGGGAVCRWDPSQSSLYISQIHKIVNSAPIDDISHSFVW